MPQIWPSVKSVALVLSGRNILPYLDDVDFQGFSKESVNNSEISDLVNILKGFENDDEANFEEWLQNQTFESGFL